MSQIVWEDNPVLRAVPICDGEKQLFWRHVHTDSILDHGPVFYIRSSAWWQRSNLHSYKNRAGNPNASYIQVDIETIKAKGEHFNDEILNTSAVGIYQIPRPGTPKKDALKYLRETVARVLRQRQDVNNVGDIWDPYFGGIDAVAHAVGRRLYAEILLRLNLY